MKFTAVKDSITFFHYISYIFYIILLLHIFLSRTVYTNKLFTMVTFYGRAFLFYTFEINTQRSIFFLHLLIFNQKRLNVYKKSILW